MSLQESERVAHDLCLEAKTGEGAGVSWGQVVWWSVVLREEASSAWVLRWWAVWFWESLARDEE